MKAVPDRPLGDSAFAPAADCVVCGGHIPAGEGVTASRQGRMVRLECTACLDRFYKDPDRYLEADPIGCRDGHPMDPPRGEWMVDRGSLGTSRSTRARATRT